MIKTIAYFLPQYHEIPENNQWWGKGFTEWTNLRKAKPLFDGHEILYPLNENYYDLLNKETVLWQTKLLNDYNVYGLCYYHYWFKGRKILEKPAENLLNWKDINQNFMFMWANHDWTKSWIGQKEMLIKQEYGDEKDWIEHIEYLIQFFKDDRYIKIDNKPVFQIYIGDHIKDYDKMMQVWDIKCRENGFNGIYIVENIDNLNKIKSNEYHKKSDAINLMEHSIAINYWRENYPHEVIWKKILKILFGKSKIRNISYDIVVQNSIRVMNKISTPKKVFFGVSTGWDNTPRYKDKGYIVTDNTPEKFEKYLKTAINLSQAKNQEIVFISCWNEWCEGMCLEPSTNFGYGFLEGVKNASK